VVVVVMVFLSDHLGEVPDDCGDHRQVAEDYFCDPGGGGFHVSI